MIVELESADNEVDNGATEPITSTPSSSNQQPEEQITQQHPEHQSGPILSLERQPVPSNRDDGDTESAYHLKWIPWNLGRIPIVMQSINGPCPLIAIMNVLLLREKVKFPQMLEQITETQLLTYIGECIMDSIPPELQNDENTLLNLEQNIHDAIEILPKLKSGLDVNIRFTGITDFEYTPECIIFDLLRIPLYHGWLCDPSLIELKNAIGNQSYNQLIDNIITNKTSQDPDKLITVLMAEEFLLRTASQLTLHGLHELKTKIKDNEIGILFRNNHFLTLFKREGFIYTLVTDHGYLTEDNIVWESLDNIEGAGRFFDSNFSSADTTTKQLSELKSIDQRQQQLENDFLMALSLSTSDNPDSNLVVASSSDGIAGATHNTAHDQFPIDDFELARRLQNEEYISQKETYRDAIVRWKREDDIDPKNCPEGTTASRPCEEEFPPLSAKQPGDSTQQQQQLHQFTTTTDEFSDKQLTSYEDQQVQPSSDTQQHGPSGSFSTDQQPVSSATRAINTTTSRSQDGLPASRQSNRNASSSSIGRRSRSEKNTKDSNCIIS